MSIALIAFLVLRGDTTITPSVLLQIIQTLFGSDV